MKTRKVLITIAVLSISSFGFVGSASAATKSITCYKGTQSKVVKAASPKCATGWTTKKPAATPTKAATAAAPVAINATYKGKMSALWSESSIDASVTGSSSANNGGLSDLVGAGSYASQEGDKCITLAGEATLKGGSDSLKLEFVTPKSTACGKDADGPTSVEINGLAKITGGTGKYAGATGTLKVDGSFASKHPANGVTEKVDLTLTLSGNIVTK
ncbi:hypothetical protein MCEMRE182_01054 [Candidatus Nanopelagicaceae bacterium]